MLKGKRSVSACSLSSCRIRAEALARAFNNRIWPCVWLAQRSSSAERDDGMSNGIDDEEEFFDASPSPVEVEDESLFCQQHSSAATEAGRAKLYELLQQHAGDDAIDVFYDVSEGAGVTRTASDTCLKDHAKKSEKVDKVCESPQCCRQLDDESYFSNNSDSNEKDSEVIFSNSNHSSDEPVECELNDSLDSEFSSTCQQISPCSEKSTTCSLICEDCHDDTVQNGFINTEDRSKHSVTIEKMVLEQNESKTEREEQSLHVEHTNLQNSLTIENNILNENEGNVVTGKTTKDIDLPSVDSNCISSIVDNEKNSLSDLEEQEDKVPVSLIEGEVSEKDKYNKFVVEVTKEIESPSATSDVTDVKTTSPTSRLQVFDELRPKISRSTSLKTGKTPPGTPSKKKIVRFADVLGLDLEDVRHIMTGDLPIIPSSAYTDLNLKDSDLPTCEPISETVEISRQDSCSWKTVQGATATNVLYPKFSIPGEQRDFMDRVRFQGICLETVLISEMNVQCTCRVMNYGYHKRVIARYTVNDWRSSNDIDASYILGSSNGETDNFAFSLFLSPQNRSVRFAVKYEVNGKDYWDNNRNQDYCLSFHGNDDHMQHLPSPLWQHQFW